MKFYNMNYHKLLNRQINKYLPSDYNDNPVLKEFINAINHSYVSYERDKELMDHAFKESEIEYHQVNNSLKTEVELKKQSIANLYDSLEVLEDGFNTIKNVDEMDDLLFISKYLNQQIEKRKEIEIKLKRQSEMKQILMNLASKYINIPSDKINATINDSLQEIAQFVKADRAYIFKYNFPSENCSNTYEWCNAGIEPQIHELQNIPLEHMEAWVEANKKGESIHIPKVSKLEDGTLKEILQSQDIKSLLVIPLMSKKECLGFVGFDSVKDHYHYTEKERELLDFFSQMIINVEEKTKIENDLVRTIELLKTLLANLQSGVLVEDENRKILFTNQLFCNMFSIPVPPETMIGVDCTNSAEHSKYLFKNPELFSSRIEEILNDRVLTTNELLETVANTVLEREYIPIFIDNEYKGHLWKYTDVTERITTQNLLEQSEERNRLIMNSALNAIITIDKKGIITFWNNQAEIIFGWKREEVLGHLLSNIIIPDQHKEQHEKGMKHYLKTNDGPVLNRQLELPGLHKNGHEFPLEISIIPVKQNGEMFFCSFIQDISERKTAENNLKYQEEKYRNIIANMNLGLIEVDTNEIIKFANQSFAEISGYEINELIGKNPSEIFVFGENFEIMKAKNNKRLQGISDIYQIPIKNKRGELKWWAISGAPNFDDKGKFVGSIGIHLDITEQKQLEIDLEKEKEKAQEASKAKEAFLSNMSHEIRTPLNAIIGFLRELEKQELTNLQKKYIDNSTVASKHLLAIINNVLDISKIEAGEMSFESEDFILENSIKNVTIVLQPLLDQKGLELTTVIAPEIENVLKGDTLRLQQILFNLIGNAIKFTQKGTISINCDVISNNSISQEIRISVSDTGIGMEKNFIDNIFNKFSQEDKGTTRKYGGTGLGLSITRELIKLMDGKIEIESEKNKGTTIRFYLNFQKGSTDNIAILNIEKTITRIDNIAILLVEDNYLNRMVAQNSLQYFNCKVTEAENGLEALEILKNQNFDVILMDIQMPEMGGIEATEIIRKKLKITTPIIALTANAFKTEIDKCKKVGMDDYVTKPFDEDVLIETIAKHTINKKPLNLTPIQKETPDKLYDLNSLNNLGRGDTEFIDKMIFIFVEQTTETIEKITNAIHQADYVEVSRLIHKIKPSVESMGITSVLSEIKHLEKIAKTTNDKEQIIVLFNIIKKVLEEAVLQIKKNEFKN